MANQWRNRGSTLQLKGFDELIEKLQEAGKSVDNEGRKCFEQAAENIYDSLFEQSRKAGLPERLVEQIEENFIEMPKQDVWSYEVGWKKQKPSTESPLPDTYKVMFFNYGTPSGKRFTKEKGQHILINGKWVTLGNDRGQESPHPKGSHGFIKKAKLAAERKNEKLFKDFLERVLGDLKK